MRGTAEFLVVVHFLWAAWMVSGVLLAVAGYRFPGLWRLRIFRLAHMVGLIITATVPLWNRGICPLTIWERRLSDAPGPAEGSFIIRWLYDALYLDVSPTVLSLISAAGAMVTIWIFIFHPPGGRALGAGRRR